MNRLLDLLSHIPIYRILISVQLLGKSVWEAYVFLGIFFEQTVSDGEMPVGLPHAARTHGAVYFISLNMACIHNTNDKLLPASHLEAESTSCICRMSALSFT